MAQGIVKVKKSTTAAGSGRGGGKSTAAAAAGRQKKGARVIKPKKRDLVKGREIVKKYSAGLTAMTERTLGAKAGHLELLKGGKKNKDAKEGKDSKGRPLEVRKGGSRKFG